MPEQDSKRDYSTKPVGDDVARVDGAVAVGEDLDFQRRWWRFEKAVWAFFGLIIALDISGLLGRGPLAKAECKLPDGSLDVKYERVERAGTPSILTVKTGSQAVADGKLRLFVSDSVVADLGTQRVIPQPETSTVGNGGITYTFDASQTPIMVQFELKPSAVGMQRFSLGVPGAAQAQARVLVLP